jgi:peptide-methionine (S)-S-oxide reductase
MTTRSVLAFVTASLLLAGCEDPQSEMPMPKEPVPEDAKTATFGQGCYWCAEAVFQRLDGVYSVESGFSGGADENPTYEEVCEGDTGHAEVVQIRYDEKKVRYEDLLEVFWKTHDPTTPNRQGADVGTQYRSIILFHDPEQKKLAHDYLKRLDESGAFEKPIVTEIAEFKKFYKAKDDHQNYYNRNKEKGYCRQVIKPKLDKFEKVFHDKLRNK